MASRPFLDLPPLPPGPSTGSLTPLTGAIQVRGASALVADDAGAREGSPGAATAGTDDAATPYSGGGAGGKARSARRASVARSKKTPYARPASGRHATPGGTAATAAAVSSSSSMAFRLVDSASRLISSSATYLFSSFLGRRPPLAIANGDVLPVSVPAAEEEPEEDLVEAAVDQADKHDTSSDQALISARDSVGTDRKVMDMTQVEQILKQQTWSREQVSRLTEILQTRVVENSTPQKSEAQRWREDLKKARNDATPVEVARAYMGERIARPSGLATSIQEAVHHTDRVADLQPPPGLGLIENRYRPSPVVRTWARSSGPVRTPKRSSVLDDEWASVGPIRRTRQKSLMLENSSPYARGVTGSSVPTRTFMSPPIQSSQTARKILDTLDKLTPSPKGKSLEGEVKVATEALAADLTTDVPKLHEKKSLQISEVPRLLPKMTEPGPSSGKLTLEPSATADLQAIEKSVTQQSLPVIVGSPTFIPERSKGFRMSAVFEESNSDEENRLNARIRLPKSEALVPAVIPETREAPQLSSLTSVKPSSAYVSKTVPAIASADVSGSSTKSSPSTAQANALPVTTPTFSTTMQPVSMPAVQSSGTAAVSSSVSFTFDGQPGGSSMGRLLPSGLSATSTKSNPLSLVNGNANVAVEPLVTSITSSPMSAVPAIPVSSTSPAAGTTFVGDKIQTVAAAPTGASVDTATAIEDVSEGENGTTMATEGLAADKLVDADSMAADPMAEEPDNFVMSSSASGFTFASSSAAASTATLPTFNFGPSSAALSKSALPAFTFGPGGISSPGSTFSFAVQSSGTATSTTSTNFAFGGQSGTSSPGSLFAFGAQSTPLSASPFSSSRTGNSSPSFTFGSSSAASSSSLPTFQTTSSAAPSFPVSSSAVSMFPFGAPASSSPLSSSSSAGHMFSFGASSTANPFSTSGAGNSSPAFTFSSSPAPVSSVPTFSFAGTPSTSFSSGSSSGGQLFAFGAQQTSAASSFSSAANPFSLVGTPSSVPTFQFVSSPAVSEIPPLTFGSTSGSSPSPTFAFGTQSTVSPASSPSFMFGGQSGPSPAPQPFAFGGQLTGQPQSPFSSPGVSNTFSQSGPGLDFSGGFALGATGGEKSGRKYIKAKRKK